MKRIFAILTLFFMITSFTIPFMGVSNNLEPEAIIIQKNITLNDQYVNYKDFQDNLKFNLQITIAIKNMNIELSKIENISDKKEWFVAYKEIIDKYSYILDPPETIYDYFTESELDMFFRIVQAEVGDEYSFDQKCNVASVVLNRIEHDEFGDSMFEVLIANQFATISDGRYKNVEVSETTILACEYAFMIGDTTDGCLFFESGNSNIHENYATFLFEDESGHKFYK